MSTPDPRVSGWPIRWPAAAKVLGKLNLGRASQSQCLPHAFGTPLDPTDNSSWTDV